MSPFEKTGEELKWEGKIAQVRVDSFRHEDGEEVKREVIVHPGAVAIVAHDEKHVWLVRQPREAVGEDGLLELPAGKLDVAGEPPLETAQRELGGDRQGRRDVGAPELLLHEPRLHRRGGRGLPRHGVERRGPRRGRGERADRGRPVAPRSPRRSDRGLPRLEVAHRPALAARATRSVGGLSRPTRAKTVGRGPRRGRRTRAPGSRRAAPTAPRRPRPRWSTAARPPRRHAGARAA